MAFVGVPALERLCINKLAEYKAYLGAIPDVLRSLWLERCLLLVVSVGICPLKASAVASGSIGDIPVDLLREVLEVCDAVELAQIEDDTRCYLVSFPAPSPQTGTSAKLTFSCNCLQG